MGTATIVLSLICHKNFEEPPVSAYAYYNRAERNREETLEHVSGQLMVAVPVSPFPVPVSPFLPLLLDASKLIHTGVR